MKSIQNPNNFILWFTLATLKYQVSTVEDVYSLRRIFVQISHLEIIMAEKNHNVVKKIKYKF
jgi:hypothetical protein